MASSNNSNLHPNVQPLHNPLHCNGYPPAWIRQKPPLELNFYINNNNQKMFEEELNPPEQQSNLCQSEQSKYQSLEEDEVQQDGDGNVTDRHAITSTSSTFSSCCMKMCSARKREQHENQMSSQVLACSLIVSTSTDNEETSNDGSSYHETKKDLDLDIDSDSDHHYLQRQLSEIDRTKPVIILCHGYLSWRNQMLIANLAARLSSELSCHTLRFDFSGCGHSSGVWRYADYEGDCRDLERVVRFVEGGGNDGNEHGYGVGSGLNCRVACVLGHSQASTGVMQFRELDWNRTGKKRLYVNLAGRFTVSGDFMPERTFTEEQCKLLKDVGKFQVVRRGETGDRMLEVTLDACQARNAYDLSAAVNAKGLEHIKMLTIHGDADQYVPVENAYKFDEVIPHHTLCIINGADHNFNGLRYMDDLVAAISSFVRTNAKYNAIAF